MTLLRAENVSKWYSRSPHPWCRLLAALAGSVRGEGIWALREVSIQARSGECVGVIGDNGSGKSTLLRLLAGLSAPTQGRVVLSGAVASLLDLTAGFDPELTGRENVEMGLRLLGVPASEIGGSAPSAARFAELESVFDHPLKTYSTGMRFRLGFALAVCRRPDFLLIDEVLSVGDHAFQRKCVARIREFLAAGTAAVVASHDLRLVGHLCARALWMRSGSVGLEGEPRRVIEEYRRASARWEAGSVGGGASFPRIERVQVGPVQGADAVFERGGELKVRVDWTGSSAAAPLVVEVAVFREDGLLCLHERSPCLRAADFGPGMECTTEFSCGPIQLPAGTYELSLSLFDEKGVFAYDSRDRLDRFQVRDAGASQPPSCRWNSSSRA